jgi:hypothetical protein
MRIFKSVRFAWSKEILNGVVMCKTPKPKSHDFEYTVLVKGKRLNNTSDKSVVINHRRGDAKILLSVEHGLSRRRDVNDAIRVAVENDIDEDMAGRNWGGDGAVEVFHAIDGLRALRVSAATESDRIFRFDCWRDDHW